MTAILHRLAQGLLTAWAAVSLTFFGLRLGAGDPLAGVLAQGLASPAQAAALRQSLGLDQPLLWQYIDFLRGLVRGDLGRSLFTARPVLAVIGEELPATLALASTGLIIAIAFGLALGVVAAWRHRGWTAGWARASAGLATALPVSFTGILAILALTGLLQLLPQADVDWLRRLLIPAAVLGLASGGAIARVIDAGLSESRLTPYILAARARGIPSGVRMLWHALRPALPPAVSLTALEAAYLFSGTVVTETVFSRPGLGRLLVGAILQGDYPVAQGLVALAAIFYTASHALADVLSLMADPRLRRAG